MTSHSAIILYRDRRGGWRWRIRAANGRALATGESHARKRNALRAVRAVVRAGMSALVGRWVRG